MNDGARGDEQGKRLRRGWFVALLYLALTLFLTYPLPLHLSSRLLAAGADPQFWMWTLAWDAHAFIHQPFSLFDANIFYPVHHSLAYSENLIGSAFLAAPILWVSHNPVLAMNLVELMSAFFSALGTYVLARRVGLRPASAVLAGIVFGFAPARFLRITQFHLTTIQWVPFALAFLHTYLHGGRKADLRLAVAFFSLQALTSGHGAVFLIVASVALVAYRLAHGEPIALARRLRDLGIPGVLLLLPPALVFLAYHAAKAEVPELARALDDFGISTASYFSSPSHLQKFVLSHAPAWFTTPEADAHLFPGYLPVLLSMIALWWRATPANRAPLRPDKGWRRTGLLLELAALVLVAAGVFVTASGRTRINVGDTLLFTARHPWRVWLFAAIAVVLRAALAPKAPLDILGRLRRPVDGCRRWWQERRRDIALFYALLTLLSVWLTLGPPLGLWRWVYWLPAMSFMRVPSRFVILEMLGLAVLSGIGFERLSARLTPARRGLAAAIVGALLIAEFAAMPLATEPFRVEPPPIDRWLDSQPKPFVVAEVPMPRTWSTAVIAPFNTRYMLHSTAHWQKTVHGFSGVEPALHTKLFLQIARFPDDESVHGLADLGVTYIVMHTELYRGSEQAEAEARLARYADWLTLEHVEGPGRVYSLRRPR